MQTNFKNLYEIQKRVAAKVLEKAKYVPGALDYIVAAHVEVFEFINKIGVWKWWKHSHTLDKAQVLDELADVIAFFVSYINYVSDKNPEYKEVVDSDISAILLALDSFEAENVIRNISYGIEMGQQQPIFALMAECIYLANKYVDATWEEIEDAYLKKSQENIRRQENNY